MKAAIGRQEHLLRDGRFLETEKGDFVLGFLSGHMPAEDWTVCD